MRNDHRKQRLLSMKRSSKFIAAAILAGAVRVSPDDTPERTKRIVIAQLYRRFRMARRHTLRASAWRGPESDFAETCRAAEIEAWNSLQVMKAVLWADPTPSTTFFTDCSRKYLHIDRKSVV